MRNRLNAALRADLDGKAERGRNESIAALVGCTLHELMAHLESQFDDYMTWGTWKLDGWHIDHITPLSAFDLTDPEQRRIACHYTNLQPLWGDENLRKGNRYETIS